MTPDLDLDGLRLTPYRAQHDAQTVAWLNDPDIQRNFGLSRKLTLHSHRAWVEANSDYLIWAITAEGEHFGNLLLQPTLSRQSAYLQIYLGNPAARGRGIGWRALAGALDYAFGPMGLHRVWLHTFPENTIAAALYEKAGFVREGIEREALPRQGTFVDQWRWSILAHEWQAAAAARRR